MASILPRVRHKKMSKMGTIGGLGIELWLPEIFGLPRFGVGTWSDSL